MEIKRQGNGNFAKGNKGGPGRPKNKKSITDWLRRLGDEIYDNTGNTRYELLALMLWRKAIVDEDLAAAKEILDRIEGKPTQVNINETFHHELTKVERKQRIEELRNKLEDE